MVTVIAVFASAVLSLVITYTVTVWIGSKIFTSYTVEREMANIDDEIRDFLGDH